MSTLLLLCLEFFKTGLFAAGGGLATIPFLVEMGANHPDWFSPEELANMIAVSESTPGPLGVNMATYVGYTVSGVLGSILVTFFLILPSIIIVMIIAKFLGKYMDNKYVQWVFSGLRPAVTGLIAAAGYSVLKLALFTGNEFTGFLNIFAFIDWRALVLFAAIFVASLLPKIKKLHPVVFIAIGAVIGIVIGL
ncbi:MAG TPA: chromate transporter [Clostridia bacterium]|nr:chromate transporter [Clostridia bacterium]